MRDGARRGSAGGGIAVLGIGNVLMGDDAVGPCLVRVLEAAYVFPDEVALIDAGTPGHDLSLYMEGRAAVVVVDAVDAPGRPGEVRLFGEDTVLAKPPAVVMGPHEPGLADALLMLRFLGKSPSAFHFVGVIPERVGTGTGLSRPVKEAIPRIEALVVALLARLGAPVRERVPRGTPDIWWEKDGA